MEMETLYRIRDINFMKKKVPNIINVEFPNDAQFFEQCIIYTIESNIEKGYAVSKYDLDRYCAVLLKNWG